jgi:lipopolysaccharide transport system permease protein
MVNELVEYRQLIFILTWRDIKMKYKQTVMGFFWAILMPMLIVSAGVLVRKAFSMVSGKPLEITELASITVKALPWSFFISSIKFGTNSLVGNRNLVTKIYFPREVFPVSAVFANLFDFFVASAILIIILWIAGIGVSLQLLWVPIVLIFLILLTIGLSMIFACANLFYRDVKYIVEVIVTFAIFFTPVFYDASMLGKWEPIILLNPVGAILEILNATIVLHQPPKLYLLLYSGVWAVVSFFVAWIIFHKSEVYFAENI